jgi:hypothetical protein
VDEPSRIEYRASTGHEIHSPGQRGERQLEQRPSNNGDGRIGLEKQGRAQSAKYGCRVHGTLGHSFKFFECYMDANPCAVVRPRYAEWRWGRLVSRPAQADVRPYADHPKDCCLECKGRQSHLCDAEGSYLGHSLCSERLLTLVAGGTVGSIRRHAVIYSFKRRLCTLGIVSSLIWGEVGHVIC